MLKNTELDCFSSDVLWLFEECFSLSRKDIIIRGNEKAPLEKTKKFFQMLKMRLEKVPVQYIVGNCQFMGIDLEVGPGVLIPRDDTEVLVRKTAELLERKFNLRQKPLYVIDLCSGTGAIALSLKKILGKKINICALELYETPLKYLENNILKNNLKIKIIKGDIRKDYKNFNDNQIDCIVSNPPYIPTKHLDFLSKDVKYEPVSALDGGTDGLEFYRTIARNWIIKLAKGGIMALEIGINQKNAVCTILKSNGMTDIHSFDDINSIPRVIVGEK